MKPGILALFAVCLLASCSTFTTYWQPVYALRSSDAMEKSGFDPSKMAVTDPQEGATYAYFEGESKKAIVYGNTYSLSLSKKFVLENGKLKASASAAEPTSVLKIEKRFSFDNPIKVPANAGDLLKKAGIPFTATGFGKNLDNVYLTSLFIQKEPEFIVFDSRLVQEGVEVEYVISGKNVGNDDLKAATLIETIPAGFTVTRTGSWFSTEENTETPKSGASSVEHQFLRDGDRQAVAFDVRFGAPFKPGDEFRIKLTIKLGLKAPGAGSAGQ